MNKAIAYTSVRSRSVCLGLFVLSFGFFLLFSHLLLITDPVESNYALTAKEMVISADWLSPRIYGQVWFDKPVFFYWLTAAAFKIFGFSDLAARLAPALFAAIGVVMIYWFLTKTASQPVAVIAAVILGTSLEYILLAKLVITDMVFFVFNSAALVCFFLGYTSPNAKQRWYLPMYAGLALAVLTKGPIGLLLPGLVMLVFIGVQRNWRELKKMSIPVGVLLFAVIALPWYGAMYYVHGTEFTDTFLGVHNYLRATVSEHPKDNVIYYYVVVFLLTMLPWSPLAIKAMVANYKDKSLRRAPLTLFCAIWAAAYFGFYSLMATKYLTYTFPMLFPVAIITANYLEQLLVRDKTKLVLYWVGIPLLLTTLIYIAIAYRYLTGLRFAGAVGSLLLITVFTLWQSRGQRAKNIFSLFAISQLAVYLILSLFVLPAVAADRSEKALAQTLVDFSGQNTGFYDFYSTSAVYYSGQTAVKLMPTAAAQPGETQALSWSSKYTMPIDTLDDFLAQSEHVLIVVPDKTRASFLAKAQTNHLKLLKNTAGFSYYILGN